MNELIKILKLSEFRLKLKLYRYLKQKGLKPIYKDGYLYAKGNIPVLLVAHMDTVLDKPPKEFYYDDEFDILYSTHGIGGDDRCGIYVIMKILEEYHPHILFTEKEEQGGIGAIKTIETLPKPDVKYIIEIDRCGNNDCVFYECGNQEFIEYIETFGFKTTEGIFSDISILGSAWDIGAVNLSSAYYNEHTYNEYIKFKELEHIINRVKNIIKNYQTAKYFDYQDIYSFQEKSPQFLPNHNEELDFIIDNQEFLIGNQKTDNFKAETSKKLVLTEKRKNKQEEME